MQKKQQKSPLQSLPGETKTAGVWQNLRIPIYWLVLIFPQCQPKVDKKLNLRLKKYLRRDILPVAAVVRNHL